MYFEITITEIDDLKKDPYHSHYVVSADSVEEAKQKAHNFASNWYEDEPPEAGEYIEEHDHWLFFGDSNYKVIVSVSNPIKTTLKKYFDDHLRDTYMIK